MPDSPQENTGDAPETKNEGADQDADTEGKGEEVEGRKKDAKDFIIQRKNRKIRELQKEKKKPEQEGEGEEDLIDEEITDDGRKAIEKAVGKQMQPMTELLAKRVDEEELKEVLEKYPHIKPLESKIRKYINHPDYQNASIKVIALGLAAEQQLKEEAKKEAKEEAEGKNIEGRTRRKAIGTGSLPDFDDMSDEEIQEWERKQREKGNL